MTVTEPMTRRVPHRAGRAGITERRLARQPQHTTQTGVVAPPFASEPNRGVTVRTWRGAAGLAEFARSIPTAVEDPDRFLVQTRSTRFGPFDIAYTAHSPLRWGPSVRNFGHPTRTLRLVVVLDGEVTLRQGDVTTTLGRRDGALVLGWQPATYEAHGPAKVVSCDVPADHRSLVAVPEHAPYVVGTADTALLPALAAFLCDLLRHEGGPHAPAVRAQVTDSLDTLVAGVLASLATADDDGWERRSARQRAIRHITANYADPNLTPSSLAEHLGMSKRSLQRLFEGEEMGVAQWIQSKRLEQALARLADPRYASTSLDVIALLSGYGNALTLRRGVQAATGKTPSELRVRAAS
jgi:AraC-like DNA-binding protein